MNPGRRVFLLHKLPPWLWGIAIFIGTSLPGEYLPSIVVLTPDKLLHAGAFFGLTILVYRSLGAGTTDISLRRRFFTTTSLITVGYGVFDELHQFFVPGRRPDVVDLLADALGVGLAIAVTAVFLAYRESKKNEFESHNAANP